MPIVEDRLRAQGLVLPAPMQVPPGVVLPFPWLRVFGRVNSAPGFDRQPLLINGFTELIVELYGPKRGRHARSAVGMAELPFGIPVEIEAEVEIDG